MPLSLREQRTAQIDKLGGDGVRDVEQQQPQIRGDLIVAAATCPQSTSHVLAHDLDESALQRPVHVLIGPSRLQLPGVHLRSHLLQSCSQRRMVGSSSKPARSSALACAVPCRMS